VLLQSLAIDSDFFMATLQFGRWLGIKPDLSRATVNDTLPIKVCSMYENSISDAIKRHKVLLRCLFYCTAAI